MFKQKVEEHFHRNPNIPVSDDVAKRVFLLDDRKIQLTYHMEYFATIPSKRVLIKPLLATESRRAEDFTSTNSQNLQVQNFNSQLSNPQPPTQSDHYVLHLYVCQVDPSVKPLSRLAVYLILQDLVKDEITAVQSAKVSRNEVTLVIISINNLHQVVKLYIDTARVN